MCWRLKTLLAVSVEGICMLTKTLPAVLWKDVQESEDFAGSSFVGMKMQMSEDFGGNFSWGNMQVNKRLCQQFCWEDVQESEDVAGSFCWGEQRLKWLKTVKTFCWENMQVNEDFAGCSLRECKHRWVKTLLLLRSMQVNNDFAGGSSFERRCLRAKTLPAVFVKEMYRWIKT